MTTIPPDQQRAVDTLTDIRATLVRFLGACSCAPIGAQPACDACVAVRRVMAAIDETTGAEPQARERTNVYIQWKGTDVCFDFSCECGNSGHFDGFFAHGIKCIACGAEYEMPETVYPRKITPDNPPSHRMTPVEPGRASR